MGNSDIVTSIISPGPGESVDYQVGTTGGGGEGRWRSRSQSALSSLIIREGLTWTRR